MSPPALPTGGIPLAGKGYLSSNRVECQRIAPRGRAAAKLASK